MDSAQLDMVVSALNLVGLPLIVIWAAHKGYLVTGREMRGLGQQYDRLLARYEALEERMAEEQAALRVELEGTRSQLIELLMREHRSADV